MSALYILFVYLLLVALIVAVLAGVVALIWRFVRRHRQPAQGFPVENPSPHPRL